ncbi:MAG: hypothetical protein ABI628_02050 [Chloroflexota bacterium]
MTASPQVVAPPSVPARPRIVDRGAIMAGWVGVGMAVTMAMSFLLVIPIEPIYWLLAPPAGLLIGYYANQRSLRPRGAWRRIVANAIYAGVVTGLTLALALLVVKALFFFADNGYRDPAQGGPVTRAGADGQAVGCQPGAECVMQRYLDAGRGSEFAAQGITDVSSFTVAYWQQQLSTAGLLLALSVGSAALGGAVYDLTRPKTR